MHLNLVHPLPGPKQFVPKGRTHLHTYIPEVFDELIERTDEKLSLFRSGQIRLDSNTDLGQIFLLRVEDDT